MRIELRKKAQSWRDSMDKLKKNKVIVAVVVFGVIIVGLLIAILAQTHQNKVSDNGAVTETSQKHGYMTSEEKQASISESMSIKDEQDEDKQLTKYLKMAKGDKRHVIVLTDWEGKYGPKNTSVYFYTTWTQKDLDKWGTKYYKSFTKSENGPELTNEERPQSPYFSTPESFGTKYTFKNVLLGESDGIALGDDAGYAFDDIKTGDLNNAIYDTVADYVKSGVGGLNPKDIK